MTETIYPDIIRYLNYSVWNYAIEKMHFIGRLSPFYFLKVCNLPFDSVKGAVRIISDEECLNLRISDQISSVRITLWI